MFGLDPRPSVEWSSPSVPPVEAAPPLVRKPLMSSPESRSDAPATSTVDPPQVVIIGAGPAGLTAAYQLTKADVIPTVVEADTVVGGISRTAEADGWRFDIGGHRFFTKVQPVEDLWHEILDDDEF